MVAIIKSGYSIRRILIYNQYKVDIGMAKCIGEGNYPIDVDKLSFNMKLNRFLKQLELNQNVRRNAVHISLNFTPADKALSTDKLLRIAEAFMQKIGFGRQPYLIFQHHDAAHPHLHVVTINVRANGSSIRLPTNLYLKPCRELEKEFNLVVAKKANPPHEHDLTAISLQKIKYGRISTKKALSQILRIILERYAYTNLEELNAVLRQYNVLADRGNITSRIFKTGGLVYRILDDHGAPIGIGIKASHFHSKATLKQLEEQFKRNALKRMPHQSRITNMINKSLMDKPMSLDSFMNQLKSRGIHVALYRNKAGSLQSITYVDHNTHCVFQGNSLGKPYSASAIQEKCSPEALHISRPILRQKGDALQPAGLKRETLRISDMNILPLLLQTEHSTQDMPFQLKRKRKRKKRQHKDSHS